MDSNNLPALAEPRQQPSLRSVPTDLQTKINENQVALRVIEPRDAMVELAACLTLVAPSGMSADDRTEWLKVARATIGDVSQGAMKAACATARESVRRVSDLVPTIIEEAKAEEQRLRNRADALRWQMQYEPAPTIEAPNDDGPVTVAELLAMPSQIVRIARRNNLAEPEIFEEYDRIIDQRQGAS